VFRGSTCRFGVYADWFKGTFPRQALLALGVYPKIRKREKKTPEQWIFLLTGQDLTLCPVWPELSPTPRRPLPARAQPITPTNTPPSKAGEGSQDPFRAILASLGKILDR
jgi:hypothetical protein